jgi:hypothetical protein
MTVGVFKEVWFAISEDEGSTWLPPVLLAAAQPTESWGRPACMDAKSRGDGEFRRLVREPSR